MPTIPEQLKTVYEDMMTRAQTDENFSPVFRENRRQLEKAFSAIIKATEEPSLDTDNQLPPTEVGGLFLSSVVERLKADSLPKDSVL